VLDQAYCRGDGTCHKYRWLYSRAICTRNRVRVTTTPVPGPIGTSFLGRHTLARGLTTVAAVVVAFLAMSVVPPEAQAVFPGTPGHLAFVNGFDGNIYTMYPDGTGLRQLTADGGHSGAPAWSPNGKSIAFNRNENIFVMSGRGSHVRQVTTMGGSTQPAWSPDGKRLLFVHSGDIWVVPTKRGTPRRITFDTASTCGDSSPTWSPLGTLIAYSTGWCGVSGYPQVVVRTLRTGATHIIPYADSPDFTANGAGLFFGSWHNPDDGDSFPFWENLAWSGLSGGNRTSVTRFICAFGEDCFSEGSGAPDSAFPDSPSAVVVSTNSHNNQLLFCLAASTTKTSTGWCNYSRGAPNVYPTQIDWQPLRSAVPTPDGHRP
jgi:hypothetical protein